ncbi:MAG: pyrroline-5-carboxylate reductase [Bacteroidota bacterium]
MNVLIIGAGNMGTTYAEGFLKAHLIQPSQLFFLDKSERKAEQLHHYSSNPLHTYPSAFIRNMDLVILAVKPQDFSGLATNLEPHIRENQVVLSIMAGVSMKQIAKSLGTKKVVRAMPNLPAQIGMGMTVFTTSSKVSKGELLNIQNLLNTTGKTLYVGNEMMIDAATAISGSGPGYVFYLMDAMMEVGRRMGFSDSEAQLLVTQTFLGSVHLLQRDELTCNDWVQKVASRGGTTEAALVSFETNELSQSLEDGLSAAFERARELSEM